ncbi:carbohydrate ABC transporter permease [Paenibacillus sp.]|uniref:carbohydrate ABC transporter permease n=1 Tax=Paenibacillus sp. TaxID=58172 RepID=UPI002D450CE1|nr:carbohydrate ABC transporter permease [Paenibacillus sp.]HZG54914.1 carbohydrate ABC transporter permease [Paenibacillus sp.]
MARFGYYALLLLVAAITLIPILWAFSSSIRATEDIFRHAAPLTFRTFVPAEPTLEAYANLFTKYRFYRPLFNTVWMAALNIAGGLLLNAWAAYAFAKFRFPGRDLLFAAVLVSILVPFEAVAIPLYGLVRSMGLLDTPYALLLPALANGLVIFLFRQFFEAFPDSVMESARIDGAGWQQIFYKLLVPNTVPVMISAGLLIFLTQWESFFWPLIAVKQESLLMLQVAVTRFSTERSTLWAEVYAASIVSIAVPALLLLPLQKYFMNTMTTSGSKE